FDAVTLSQIGETLAVHRALVKEVILPRLVLDEPKPLVDAQRSNRSCHPRLRSPVCCEAPIGLRRSCACSLRLFRPTRISRVPPFDRLCSTLRCTQRSSTCAVDF